MSKLVAPMLATILLLPLATTGVRADEAPTCASDSRDAEVPSGSFTDASGRTWVGFTADGTPPDSLSKSSTATVCDYAEPEPPPP